MAEFTKGIENLNEAIEACEKVSATLAVTSVPEAAAAKTAVDETLVSFNDSGSKFFMKTMMSVPPTKTCRTEAAAVAALVEQEKWDGLPAAIEKLQKAAKVLETKAKMDGTTIT